MVRRLFNLGSQIFHHLTWSPNHQAVLPKNSFKKETNELYIIPCFVFINCTRMFDLVGCYTVFIVNTWRTLTRREWERWKVSTKTTISSRNLSLDLCFGICVYFGRILRRILSILFEFLVSKFSVSLMTNQSSLEDENGWYATTK